MNTTDAEFITCPVCAHIQGESPLAVILNRSSGGFRCEKCGAKLRFSRRSIRRDTAVLIAIVVTFPLIFAAFYFFGERGVTVMGLAGVTVILFLAFRGDGIPRVERDQ